MISFHDTVSRGAMCHDYAKLSILRAAETSLMVKELNNQVKMAM